MLRTAAAITLAAVLTSLGASPVAAANQPTAEDCILYDAAFKAVTAAPQPPQQSGPPRRVAFTTWGHPKGAGTSEAAPALNLKACIALNQRIYAAGMTVAGRPAFGFRMPGTRYYEHFSRAWAEGGHTHLTYWISDAMGVDLVMSRSAGDDWTVERTEVWGVTPTR